MEFYMSFIALITITALYSFHDASWLASLTPYRGFWNPNDFSIYVRDTF